MTLPRAHFWQHRRGHLQDLATDECLELLSSRQVGRAAFTTPGGPRIVPMNYALDEASSSIYLTTGADSELARFGLVDAAPDSLVAFEVDTIDDFLEAGWSVLAVGPLRRHHGSLSPLTTHLPDAWAEGAQEQLLVLTWQQLTGRRLHST